MKLTLALAGLGLIVGAILLLLGGGWAMQTAGMATMQTPNGTYFVDRQTAAAQLAADTQWQQQQAEIAASAERENSTRWNIFWLVAVSVIMMAGVGVGVGFAVPAIRRKQAEASRYEAEARAYARYLAGRGPVPPAHLLNQAQGEILDLLPAPLSVEPARARIGPRRQ